MIVVVTILGVISSIALVKYSKVQESAKLNADYTNAANIVTAASMAINDDEKDNRLSKCRDIEGKGIPKYCSSSSEYIR